MRKLLSLINVFYQNRYLQITLFTKIVISKQQCFAHPRMAIMNYAIMNYAIMNYLSSIASYIGSPDE